MADLNRIAVRRLAVLGARARLAELRAEEATLRRAFPELARAGREQGAAAAGGEAPARKGRRRRRRMSAEARQAVSERMRRYWAERRKAKGKSK